MRVDRGRALPALAGAIAATFLSAALARAQHDESKCTPLCTPTIDLMPAVLRTHLFGGPLVEKTATGATSHLPALTNFEMIIVAASKTAIPRVTAFASVQWLPNATEQRNPFTQYTAGELGGPVHANAPTATLGLSGSVLAARQTSGIVDLGVNVGDLYSQAARPDDHSAYTHKLDLELATHWHAFDWTPPRTWLHGVTLFGLLDYVATGLPRAGDEVPQGRRFLQNARAASLIAGLVLPITPEKP